MPTRSLRRLSRLWSLLCRPAVCRRCANSSGIFQIDGLLKAKLRGSGLEPYVEVVAHIDTETEQRLVPMYRLEI